MALSVLTAIGDVQLVAGDDLRLRLTITDQDDAPVNLTGMVGRAAVVSADGTTLALSPTSIAVTIVDAANGIVQMDITGAVTATWPIASHLWQLRLEDAEGRIATPIGGQLHVRPARVA